METYAYDKSGSEKGKTLTLEPTFSRGEQLLDESQSRKRACFSASICT